MAETLIEVDDRPDDDTEGVTKPPEPFWMNPQWAIANAREFLWFKRMDERIRNHHTSATMPHDGYALATCTCGWRESISITKSTLKTRRRAFQDVLALADEHWWGVTI